MLALIFIDRAEKVVVILIKIFMADGVSEMRIRSSAKARQLRGRLLEMLTPIDGGRMSSNSSRIRLNRIGLRGSPCLTPRRSLILGRLVGPQRMWQYSWNKNARCIAPWIYLWNDVEGHGQCCDD